ncbi:MAG: YraN family protein [Gemmatimonadota bacterium]
MSEAYDLGITGEKVAERFLLSRGWQIIQRRYRSGHRDIDLVASRRGTVAFVEVKTRSGAHFGGPLESVNWAKQRELRRSAFTWIDRHGRLGEQYRFDVVGVLIDRERVRVRHVENAFSVGASG